MTTQDEMTRVSEQSKRNKLKEEKPYVYDKVVRYEEKVKRGESIAILQFQYDYTCNFHCEHCSADKFMVKTKSAKNADKRRFFTLEDVRELSRQGDAMGLANIVITGGEPLVYPDFDKVVEAIDPAKWYVTSDSNGWHLDLKRARHLKSIGVDKIQLSLDSFRREEHDRFRQKPGSYDRVIRAVDACLEAGLNLIFQTVLWKERCYSQEFIDMLEFGQSKGVGTYVTFAKAVGAWEGRMEVLCGDAEWNYVHDLEKKYNVFTHLTPGYGIDVGCIAVKRMVSITKYGDVMPCPYTHTSLGNFFEEPLESIINRGLRIKYFGYGQKHVCLVGNKDDPFIEERSKRMYGKQVPVPFKEVFEDIDFVDNKCC
ncbi:MAG: radical SAM protein [Magnetococcales bacterium]|nr:radical SAM protein [Magnetococcales bacterium]MBF0321895.1 radical SAM protein [Magnetococcales bacterium]